MIEHTEDNSPAYEHVLTSISEQMTASRKVLHKLRGGVSLFPRLSVLPALLTVLCAWLDLGVWAVVLGIAATSALLIGTFSYAMVERRMVGAIKGAVASLDALSADERDKLLADWLS